MTYKDYVERPMRLQRKLKHKIEDVQLKLTICQATTSGISDDKVQTSAHNRTEDSYMRYIDAKRELNALAEELEETRKDVRAFLYSAISEIDADLLEWRYIEGKSASEIADMFGVTYDATRQRIKRANKQARDFFEHNFNKKLKN